MTLTSELLELSQHLQTENLFASNEREQLQRLYNNITILAEELNHSSWVLRRQKLNLQQFWQQGHLKESTDAYAINNQLEDTKFVDSYKVFSYHDSKYGELLRYLYDNPLLLAKVVMEGDRQDGIEVDSVISLTISSIYSNCILQEDEAAVLKFMKTLLEQQVASSLNPRRLFSRTSIAFTKSYRILCDSLFSARLFLTAALYEPIMRVLMEDEWFYDIDPDKALVRFPPHEKLKRFGEPGTPEHIIKLQECRKESVDKLVLLASRFINSIKSNIHCFPASIGWLISQVYRVLTERGQVSMQEIRTSCADLVFDRFICPAICDPEPFGITSDVPISHISRHNLMQMAKIIQVLAISQWEEIDPKVQDLYGRFDKGTMSSVLDLFFEGSWDEFVDQMQEGSVMKTPDGAQQECAQSCVLVTQPEIKDLVGFLRSTTGQLEDKTTGKQQLETLLSALPAETPPSSDNLATPRGGVITPTISQPPAQNAAKSKSTKKKSMLAASPSIDESNGAETPAEPDGASGVLVVSIRHPSDCPGMLPEKKVLSTHRPVEPKHKTFNISNPSTPQPPEVGNVDPPLVAPNPEIQEKRTRFSLSHDQESIGNASDYQEVISEAASSHSVEDEEENELEADNFSDMISANVSGRGSPSISGRDTPLSQAGSVEENPVAPQLPMPVPVTVRKENRVDVTDRFGKFEIKAELIMERDEFQSTVSDTWSTDVLASDSEPPESNVDRLEEVAEEIVPPPYLPEPISELSETASDAWSTDVLASDTDEKHSELLKDLEQDLLVGAIDREGEGGSVGQEEGEENSLDSDHLGAVGGGGNNSQHHHHRHQDSSVDAFPDVFSEPHTTSHRFSHPHHHNDDPFHSPSTMSTGRKHYSTSHHTHSSSSASLQLPPMSMHRQSSPRNLDSSHRSTVGFSGLHDSSSSSPMVHSSTGARSKVKDKDGRHRKLREHTGSRGSLGSVGSGAGSRSGMGSGGVGGSSSNSNLVTGIGGGGGEDGIADFDPLSSGGSSGSHKGGNISKQPVLNITSTPCSSIQTSSESNNSNNPNNKKLRNSGSIDIWVSSNGQVSGNSTQHSSAAAILSSHSSSFDSNSDNGLPPPNQSATTNLHQHQPQQQRTTITTSSMLVMTNQSSSSSILDSPSFSSSSLSNQTSTSLLESNLNNLNLRSELSSSASSSSTRRFNTSSMSMDSGLASSSSVFRPLSEGSISAFSPQPLEMSNPAFNLTPGNTSSVVVNNLPQQSSSPLSKPGLSHNDSGLGFKPVDSAGKPNKLPLNAAGSGRRPSGDIGGGDLRKRRDYERGRTNSSELFKKIPLVGDDDESRNNSESVKLAEQQSAGLTERRFSAALTMFDPFPSGLDDQSMDIGGGGGEVAGSNSTSSHLNDFAFKWEEEDIEEGDEKQQNRNSVIVVEDMNNKQEEDKNRLVVTDDDIGGEMAHRTSDMLRPRRDSSGSSGHSASSLKGNTSQGESVSSAKDCGGDNVSMISDDKEFTEDDSNAVTIRNKKATSGSGFLGNLRSVRDKFHSKVKKKSAKFEKDVIDTSEAESPTSANKINPLPAAAAAATKDRSSTTLGPSNPSAETTDDILAKYRTPKKPTSLTKNNNSPAVANNNIMSDGPKAEATSGTESSANANGQASARNSGAGSVGNRSSAAADEEHQLRPFYDSTNVEGCPAFLDAKRKLRLVLSNGLVGSGWTQVHSNSPRSPVAGRENELTHLLKTQLAEAINLQSKDQVAQLYEVIRCVRPFDLDGCKKLVESMKAEYKSRSPYIAYLIRCRNQLLAKKSHLQRFLNRINRDKEISRKHLANMSAQKFLDKREKHMWKFTTEFRKLTMADEKIDLLQGFLDHLYSEMMHVSLWKPASEQQLDDAKLAIERFVMSRIYTAAMFPNGEGDIMRDQVLQEHLQKLSQVISPSHKDIRIPPVYHMECPWPAAQREIFSINAYKTPKDKIQCVLRCSKTILNLLSLANQKSVPAADDFLPVLIFVLIKANPFGLLSTIQYVNSFYGDRLHGEEHYWWMQLTSAVEFIKNMNYSP